MGKAGGLKVEHEDTAEKYGHTLPQRAYRHYYHLLHLGDVVGDTGNQGVGGKLSGLLKGKGHDLGKQVLAYIVTKALDRHTGCHRCFLHVAGPQPVGVTDYQHQWLFHKNPPIVKSLINYRIE